MAAAVVFGHVLQPELRGVSVVCCVGFKMNSCQFKETLYWIMV